MRVCGVNRRPRLDKIGIGLRRFSFACPEPGEGRGSQPIRIRFPKLPVFTVHNFIEPAKFYCPKEKKVQIAFMPQKRRLEAAVNFDLFRAESPKGRKSPGSKSREKGKK